MKIFPKYIKIDNGSELIRTSILEENKKANYFRPCGEWEGELVYDEPTKQYILFINGFKKFVNIQEITAKEFLKGNPYGYSGKTKNSFETAIEDYRTRELGVVGTEALINIKECDSGVYIRQDKTGIVYSHIFS